LDHARFPYRERLRTNRPPGLVARSATRRGPRQPSCAGRIVRQSAWHGTRRTGSGCCCPRPIRHGLAALCGQVRSPRGQSRRRHNLGRGALPLNDAGAAQLPGVPEVVQPSRNACNEKRPEAVRPRAQFLTLHFGRSRPCGKFRQHKISQYFNKFSLLRHLVGE